MTRIVGFMLLVITAGFSGYASPFGVGYFTQDVYHSVPAGYEDTQPIMGDWDYYALIYDSFTVGRKFRIACSVVRLTTYDELYTVVADTTKYNPRLDIYTASVISIVFPERPKVRDGDNIVVYCRFRQLFPYQNQIIPVFDGDGWQFWNEYESF